MENGDVKPVSLNTRVYVRQDESKYIKGARRDSLTASYHVSC